MTEQQPPAADWADEKATEILPCYDPGAVTCVLNEKHYPDCPAYYRELVATTLREAEQRGREQERERIAIWLEDYDSKTGRYALSHIFGRNYGAIAAAIRQRGEK